MGLLLSRFRTKKTTFQILEELEKNIQSIEQYGYNTEQRRRRVVGTLMAFSIGLYILAVLLFYFKFRLTSWKDLLLYALPLLIFPFVIYIIRYTLSWYYEWKIKKNKTKLIDLRAEKKKILEEVIDTETYKKAKQILEKFGEPKDALLSATSNVNNSPIAPVKNALATPAQLRQRQAGPIARGGLSNTPLRLDPPNLSMTLPREIIPSSMQRNLARPLLPAHRGPFDRLVDYLIGDGPENRFALICMHCKGHNGMALPEEFEFISYRCAYCQAINPAKKQKPKPPPLVTSSPQIRSIKMREHLRNSSDSDNYMDDTKNEKSDSDTDMSTTFEEKKEPEKSEESDSNKTESKETANNGEVINEDPMKTD